VATSPDPEPTEASPQRPKKPLTWRGLLLGLGCLGLFAWLGPVIIPVLGMYLWAVQEAEETRIQAEQEKAEQATREARAHARGVGAGLLRGGAGGRCPH